MLDKYKIEIPPTYIKSIIKSLPSYNNDFVIQKETIIFHKQPIELQEKYRNQQKELDDIRDNITELNQKLENLK